MKKVVDSSDWEEIECINDILVTISDRQRSVNISMTVEQVATELDTDYAVTILNENT